MFVKTVKKINNLNVSALIKNILMFLVSAVVGVVIALLFVILDKYGYSLNENSFYALLFEIFAAFTLATFINLKRIAKRLIDLEKKVEDNDLM